MPFFFNYILVGVVLALLPSSAFSFSHTKWRKEARIVGGYEASAPEWLTVLRGGFMGDRHACGATLIHEQWILTAAHCVNKNSPVSLTYAAWIGGEEQDNPEEFEQIPLDMFIVHPLFTTLNYEFDLAIGRLQRPSTHKPAKLNTDEKNEKTGKMLSVMGWGIDSPDSKMLMEHVRRVEVPVAPQATCKKTMGYPAGQATTICAGFKAGGYDACTGDSGGPLFAGNSVVGIVSFGNKCALPDLYGVYTRVSVFKDWIESEIKANTATSTAEPVTFTTWPDTTAVATPDKQTKTTTSTTSRPTTTKTTTRPTPTKTTSKTTSKTASKTATKTTSKTTSKTASKTATKTTSKTPTKTSLTSTKPTKTATQTSTKSSSKMTSTKTPTKSKSKSTTTTSSLLATKSTNPEHDDKRMQPTTSLESTPNSFLGTN